MRWYSHLAVGFAISGFIVGVWDFKLMLIVAISSLLPDLDYPYSLVGSLWPELSNFLFKRFGHRGLLHSLLLPLGLIVDILLSNSFYVNLFCLAYSLHILLDMMTYQGVKLLYPWDYYFTILDGDLESNSLGDNLKVTIPCVVLFIVWLLWKESITAFFA
ncbi:MAG: metal-dependent hydrolase [Candidatus Nanoarchaeia archaeon]|jgi:inner membrane protein